MGNAPSVTGPDRGRSHVIRDVDSDDSSVGHRPVRSRIDDKEAELADKHNTEESNRKSSSSNVPESHPSHKYKDISHPAVKAANKSAKSEIRKSKRNFEFKLARNIKSDTKSFFYSVTYVGEDSSPTYVTEYRKSKVETGPLLNNSGAMLDSQTDMAEEFNRYRASVFSSENVSHLPTAADMFLGPADEKCSDVLFTLDDIMKALSKLRVDKASGADDLSPRFLLQVKDCIAYPLLL